VWRRSKQARSVVGASLFATLPGQADLTGRRDPTGACLGCRGLGKAGSGRLPDGPRRLSVCSAVLMVAGRTPRENRGDGANGAEIASQRRYRGGKLGVRARRASGERDAG
jgi:hypothetical protein